MFKLAGQEAVAILGGTRSTSLNAEALWQRLVASSISTCSASLQPSTSSPLAASAEATRPSAGPQPSSSSSAVDLTSFRDKIAAGPNFMDFVQGKDLTYSVEAPHWKERKRKPDWMKRPPVPGGEKYLEIKEKLRELKLHTVCEEAKCPNIGECWGGGEDGHGATATIMLMGDTCTRGCRFCAVKTSRAPPPLDTEEPEKVATAIAAWGLDYVVLTSVDRDDLPDHGSGHFARTISLLKQKTEGRLLVEALLPDFQGRKESVAEVVSSGLDVFAHNIETVERLQGVVRDRRANWAQSLGVLRTAKELGAKVTKTSIMLGCGETQDEVVDAFRQLRANDVDVVTLGQYMRPTKKHMAVEDYVTPEAFAVYQALAESMGFAYVASGPMVRSSYRAGEFYLTNMLRKGQRREVQQQEAAAAAAAAPSAAAVAAPQ
uniref:Lipoyl synthase, mitochondrial n=2 Tax=Dunaliella tertiolecta TaxID=3047 RepID=A0A7S3R1U1_DUNTE|mmetsp:Transcript_12321/g.33606  ORF Transcript_12321/g.33606 Transcript_12321/m.33606 type:complete len:432 (-) Transcript_12321:912-2207(-)